MQTAPAPIDRVPAQRRLQLLRVVRRENPSCREDHMGIGFQGTSSPAIHIVPRIVKAFGGRSPKR